MKYETDFLKAFVEGTSLVSRIKKSFHLYLVKILKDELNGNEHLSVKDVYMTASGIRGQFILNEPADEGGEREAVYEFSIKKKEVI